MLQVKIYFMLQVKIYKYLWISYLKKKSFYTLIKLDTVDSRYLKLDGTMEKIRIIRRSTQEELRKPEV